MGASKAKSLEHLAIWTGAVLVGIAAVLYAKLISFAQGLFFARFSENPYLLSLLSPFAFVIATALVRELAPDAKGSGIPQVLEAIELGKSAKHEEAVWLTSLVSLKTALIKVMSSMIGILGGASIGREGPTVQIASSGFAWIGRLVRKRVRGVELPSYLTAGAAAGVAAAFNTPLAGITFAVEEVAEGVFGEFRQTMILAVIISGITAQALIGDYLYFGHPSIPKPDFGMILVALVIGTVAGVFGGAFARLLAFPQMTRLPKHWAVRTLLCGILCASIGLLTRGATAGSGYEVTNEMLTATSPDQVSFLFPIYKLITTVLSYLSGMAGGIFSPSLSIGAGIGVSISKILHFSHFKACALMGMVGFFSGAIQAPLTGVIIVMEMTDEHMLILPFLISGFFGLAFGRLVMPEPLYRFLARRNQEA